MPSFVAIDPGKEGFIARIMLPGWEADVWPLGTAQDLIARLKDEREWLSMVMLEQVQPFRREKSGVVPAFRLGESYGQIQGILAAMGISYTTVRPQQWQKALSCLSGGDKHVTRAKAQQYFPQLKITLKNADALLIARYCAERYGFPQYKEAVR